MYFESREKLDVWRAHRYLVANSWLDDILPKLPQVQERLSNNIMDS
jgi:hypothetical protein